MASSDAAVAVPSADAKKFQPPKWCRAPRDPERCKQNLLIIPAQGGGGQSSPSKCSISTKAVYTIGRAPSGVDVRLTGELASRLHAAVCQDADGRKFLVDLHSTHGTFLDGQKLEPHKPVRWRHKQRACFGSASGTAEAAELTAPPARSEAEGVRSAEPEGADVGKKRPAASTQDGQDSVERRQAAEPEAKKPKVVTKDPLADLYGDLPEATVLQTAPRIEERRRPEPIQLSKEPTKFVFLDIDGVLRSVHGRTDFAQNVRTMLVDGSRVALLGDSQNDNLAGIDFWPQAMRALRYIVQKTEAAVVLSSDWRKQPQLVEGVNNQLTEYGMPKLVGQTPDLDAKNVAGVLKALHSNVREKRAKEIRKWLKQHPNVERWVAIDDMDLTANRKDLLQHELNSGNEPLPFLDAGYEFVRCNPAVGLTMELAKLAVAFLKGIELTEEELAAAYATGPAQDAMQLDPNFQGLGPTTLIG